MWHIWEDEWASVCWDAELKVDALYVGYGLHGQYVQCIKLYVVQAALY
jgi:hypothetical protein